MLKSIYLLVSFLFLGFGVYGQEAISSSDQMTMQSVYREIITPAQKPENEVQGVFQVPVVVHVMHLGEPVGQGVNISDADVRAGIRDLNNRWRKMPGTVGDGNGVDMEIEFVLAVQDPDGNPTNGIVRKEIKNDEYIKDGVEIGGWSHWDILSAGMNIKELKDKSKWPENSYINIWIVSKINGSDACHDDVIVGGANFGFISVNNDHPGLIMPVCRYLNKNQVDNPVMTHHVGLLFCLMHPFSDDSPNE